MENNRDFKGIWLPKEVWLAEDLNAIDKIILAEIDSLDNENHCIAGNEYFAKFCQCSEVTVSRSIAKLIKLGYISKISFDGRVRKLKSNCKVRVIKMTNESYQNDNSDLSNRQGINISNNLDNNPNINKKNLIKKRKGDTKNIGSKPKLIKDYIEDYSFCKYSDIKSTEPLSDDEIF